MNERGAQGVTNILVSRKKIEWIAYNHEFSEHAKIQFVRRGAGYELDLRGRILNSPLSWKTHNDCVAVALDLYRYIVVGCPEMGLDKPPVVVTFVDLEPSGCTVVDKMLASYRDAVSYDQSTKNSWRCKDEGLGNKVQA